MVDDEKRWHSLSIEEAFDALKSSPWGLATSEAERRLEEYGPNELQEEKGTGKLSLLAEQVKNPLIAVLAFAAVISLLAGKTIDAVVIVGVISINTLLGFYKE